jgi:DNA-binding transcriptional MerR regulator
VSATHEPSLKLDELAERAGVSPRTIRYYVQRGLLPAPAFRGRDTAYTHEHLVRLRAIRRLQELHLPLDAIQAELARRSLDELEGLASGKALSPMPNTPVSALALPPVYRHAAEPARGESAHGGGARITRWVLAPGVELSVSDEAGDEARALVDELRSLAHRRTGHGGARR